MVAWFRTFIVAVLFACLWFPAIAAHHLHDDRALSLRPYCDAHIDQATQLGTDAVSRATVKDVYQPYRYDYSNMGSTTVTAR